MKDKSKQQAGTKATGWFGKWGNRNRSEEQKRGKGGPEKTAIITQHPPRSVKASRYQALET